MLLSTQSFAAVRRTASGFEFIDLDTIDYLAGHAKHKAETVDSETPNWAKENPVVRIIPVEVMPNISRRCPS